MKKLKIINKKRLLMALQRQNRAGCSDKKLLWRANLYVDENHIANSDPFQLHDKDWNDLHPWTYGNEWNKEYDGSFRLDTTNIEPTESEYLKNLPVGNGGQVVSFQPFTYPYQIDSGNGEHVVAYSYGDNDNPFEFNDELYQQMEVCAQYYNTAAKILEEGDTSWFKTTSPGGDMCYQNYRTPNDEFGLSDTGPYSSVPTEISSRDRSLAFPFLPSWSLDHYLETKEVPYSDWFDVISIGVDCVGLAQRAASYNSQESGSNPYIWKDIEGHNLFSYADWWDDNRAHPYSTRTDATYSWQITFKPEYGQPENLNLVRPGDIIVIFSSKDKDNDGRPDPMHTAIVQDVIIDDSMSLDDIHIIEATWEYPGLTWARVVNYNLDQRTMGLYENFYSWEIVRLCVE